MLRRGYLASSEQVLLETHPSKWWYFVGPALWGAILVIFDSLVAGRAMAPPRPAWQLSIWPSSAPVNLLVAIAVVLNVMWFVWLGLRTYEWAFFAYAVTDDRIVQQTGIIRHVVQEIPIRQVRDVVVYQTTLWGRVFRYGNVRFKSLAEPERPGALSLLEEAIRGSPNPRSEVAMSSGVEFWFGVPNPFLIERVVEAASRTPVPVAPQPTNPVHPWPRG